jgi:hypothetical protein
MSQEITRIYATLEDAENAVAALAEDGFTEVHLVAGAKPAKKAAAAARSTDEIATDIMKGYVLRDHARVYAESVAKGSSLVTAHAPFGSARKVMAIMDEFSPVESGITEVSDHAPIWDEAAPVSSALGMPVLASNTCTFSSVLGVPELASSSWSFSGLFGIPLLSRPAQKTTSFGLPLLSDNPAPLSSMLGLPTLTRDRAPR